MASHGIKETPEGYQEARELADQMREMDKSSKK